MANHFNGCYENNSHYVASMDDSFDDYLDDVSNSNADVDVAAYDHAALLAEKA